MLTLAAVFLFAPPLAYQVAKALSRARRINRRLHSAPRLRGAPYYT